MLDTRHRLSLLVRKVIIFINYYFSIGVINAVGTERRPKRPKNEDPLKIVLKSLENRSNTILA